MCKLNGNKIREIRIAKGMTQKELGERIGISACAINNYEIGRTGADEENLKNLCEALETSEDEIKVIDFNYNFLSQESKTIHKARGKKGFKRLYTPEETEVWLDSHRLDTEEKAKGRLKNAVKNSFGIGDKKYCLLNPEDIYCQDWQRNTDFAKAMEIAENYDEKKFDPVKIYIVNGKPYCADGMHRVIAMVLKNIGVPESDRMLILVEILDCTEQEAIDTFLGQQAGRKAMSTNDTYRAAIKAKIPEYIDFRKVFFEDFNIQITSEKQKLENPVGKIDSSRTVLRMVHNQYEPLKDALTEIINLDWCGSVKGNPFLIRNLNTLIKLYAVYGKDVVNTTLKKKYYGAEKFESHVAKITSGATLYDTFAKAIREEFGEQVVNNETPTVNNKVVRKFA